MKSHIFEFQQFKSTRQYENKKNTPHYISEFS